MISVYIVSENESINIFADASRKLTVKVFSVEALKASYSQVEPASIVYFDMDSMKAEDSRKLLKKYTERKDLRYGIIDPGGDIRDIAELFFSGYCDYIGKDLLAQKVSSSRISQIEKFCAVETSSQADENPGFIISDEGWKSVKAGSEYTFCFIYVELDDQKALKEYFSGQSFNTFRNSFMEMIEKRISQIEGRIWMWEDFGGLILIPFNGKNIPAIELFFRLYLNMPLICVEEMKLEIILSMRTAIHVGNTVYKTRGHTGELISDSINSVNHMIKKYADSGSFIVTENASSYIPGHLRSFFRKSGEFEGRKIIKMKNFMRPSEKNHG